MESLPSTVLQIILQHLLYDEHTACPTNRLDFWCLALTCKSLLNLASKKFGAHHHDRDNSLAPCILWGADKAFKHQDGGLPHSITHLVLGDKYNQPIIKGALPQSLLILTFGNEFNQMIAPDTLPDSITRLTFGVQPSTPPNLQILIYGINGSLFNQPLQSGSLPRSLRDLSLGDMYSHAISPGLLPNSMTRLALGRHFDRKLDDRALPHSLISLELGQNYHHAASLPSTIPALESLVLYECNASNIQKLPPVTSLKIWHDLSSAITLPDTLTWLTLPHMYNNPNFSTQLAHIRSLAVLEFGNSFDQPINPGSLPSSLTSIHLGYQFNHMIIHGTLPSSLKSLEFSDRFNQCIAPGVLPMSLTKLTMGFLFEQTLEPGALPSSLLELRFGTYSKYRQPFVAGTLPPSLKHLSLGSNYSEPIVSGALPDSLTYLKLSWQRTFLVCLPASIRNLLADSPEPVVISEMAIAQSHIQWMLSHVPSVITFQVNIQLGLFGNMSFQYLLRRIDQSHALWISRACPSTRQRFIILSG
ncbi:hypothetical protein SAMD00019534_051420 [Acytostelium subglobosum LB1]|uniref:hypothetical protein n=1 Tax=Acytostelium subglobosum LB1 TaxID=1410327 RepID=UPI000644C01C|nr:hypothetical protein SAMD00019534_051420 [Acytostelium subglobosum LB1]GAM21967.1 hypothetical protein SAMD00019534_051420 [Acytostelium subglobosum LB1]|eukprot:XP_012755067.1 hypothetical protein SAMD00019534_051420 [Acytostelium subglobosum LB1]